MDPSQLERGDAGTDAVVVGASTAGLLTALLLARGGLRVEVHDRAPHPQAAERTLIVTSAMRRHLAGIAELPVINQISRFEMGVDGYSTAIDLDEPDLIVERRALIEELARMAFGAGAAIHFGSTFTGLAAQGDGVAAEFEQDGNGRLRRVAPYVIGADGTSSAVARAAGWPAPATTSLIQALVDLPSGLEASTAIVWFRPHETPYFYWLIPETDDRAAVGVIGAPGGESRKGLDAFLEEMDLVPIEYQAARVPVYPGWKGIHKTVGGGQVYVVGDAAAQVKMSTVGGLLPGLRGAIGVARRILGDRSPPELRALRRELGLHLLVRRAIHGFSTEDYRRLLSVAERRLSPTLSSRNRDEVAGLLLGVLRSKPSLLLRAGRALTNRAPLA